MSDGLSYTPRGTARTVVKPGEFCFAAIRLDHDHIHGMCRGLIEAGAELTGVYDPDPTKIEIFHKDFPGAVVAASEQALLEDPSVQLIASAAVPSQRGDLGLQVLDHAKHYFSDKAPFTSLEQVARARAAVQRTGLQWAVYYSERLHTEAGVRAGQLIQDGAIGRVIQVLGMGPHRLRLPTRAPWFFKTATTGGILVDIGSHQCEQFLYYSGAADAQVVSAQVANYAHGDHPEFEDFGQATLVGDNGATGYFRVDWFSPDGLKVWGDGRTFILGTLGYLELRNYTNVAVANTPAHLFLVNQKGEYYEHAHDTVGYPYFGQVIRDCLDGTHTAMSLAHTFKAAELCLQAQAMAQRISG